MMVTDVLNIFLIESDRRRPPSARESMKNFEWKT